MASSARLVVIVGPTASGKSALALEVARRFNGEIIAADSRTVYKDMDIGTAKPTRAERTLIPHHLLDIVAPGQRFTAADFKRLANEAIEGIVARGKLPILVGGTGLYIDAVIFDYQFGPEADLKQRESLQTKSVEELIDYCISNNIALPVNRYNKRHLIRTIELGGVVKHTNNLRSDTIVVGISTSNEVLKGRIFERAQQMLHYGLIKEVKDLKVKYKWEGEAFTGNIYPLFNAMLEGEIDQDQALERFIRSDIKLAKRQMTWFKRNPYIHWSEDAYYLLNLIEQFLTTKPFIS